MKDYKVHLYKSQQQYLTKLLPKGCSFQLYKVRKNINDYQHMQFDRKLKKQQSILFLRQQSLSNKQSIQFPLQSQSKIQKNQIAKVQPFTILQQKCLNLLKKLKKHQAAHPFKNPVDAKFLQVPQYQQIVLQPIDLKTIEQNIRKNEYQHFAQFERDIYKMMMNSYKFNQKDTSTFQKTKVFQEYFIDLLRQKSSKQIVIHQQQNHQNIFNEVIVKQQNIDQMIVDNNAKVKEENEVQDYSNINFNKLMSEYESKVEQQLSEPQIAYSNKISATDVQKGLSSMIRKLNMHSLTKIKKNKLSSKLNIFQINMPLGQKRKLFQKMFKLKEEDHVHVVQMLTRNQKIVFNQNQFQIDFEKIDNKILRQIQNFILLRSQSHQNIDYYKKERIAQKRKKIKKKHSKRLIQDQSYHSQCTKIKIKFYKQDDEYLPQNQISEEVMNQSCQSQRQKHQIQEQGEADLNQYYHENEFVFPIQNTPNQADRSSVANRYNQLSVPINQESNMMQHSIQKSRQNVEDMNHIDQIDLYFSNDQQDHIHKYLWDQ